MREAITAIIVSTLIGLSTWFVEEKLFEHKRDQDNMSHQHAVTIILEHYEGLLDECRTRDCRL